MAEGASERGLSFSYPPQYSLHYDRKPFPHAVLHDAWDSALLSRAAFEVAMFADREWDGEKDFHGATKKRFCSTPAKLPLAVREIIAEANSPQFVEWLEALTGERDLIADPYLIGGGIHSTLPGGFLGMHTDFNYLEGRQLYRRLNVLLYLNKGWQDGWGGALELHGADGSKRSILPERNTMVVFTTDDASLHGHPHPLACPDGVSRDSIALYYYSTTKPTRNFSGPRTNTDYAPTAAPVRLNLGCGARHMKGFVNVDFPSNWCERQPDLAHDLTKPLPHADGSVDELHAYHLFEHFYRFDADRILDDWVRALKPGGKMVLEMPCMDKILSIFNHCANTGQELPDNLTMWGLYGDPNHGSADMCHRWCYSIGELTSMLNDRGLSCVSEEPKTHQPVRDMRIVAHKPAGAA